jgi:hypothetical protein
LDSDLGAVDGSDCFDAAVLLVSRRSAMALPLIGYFCTMVSAFAVLMFVLSGVISPREIRQPHPIISVAASVAQPVATEKKSEEAAVAARPSIKTAASRDAINTALRKKQQLARNAEKRKMLALRRDDRRDDRGYPTALAFGQEYPNERGSYDRMPPFFSSRF